METIRIYLETMFKSLPQTGEMLNLKQELLANMEDKYTELKSAGKTENEAIGTVISEFGNIDELLSEMGTAPEAEAGPAADARPGRSAVSPDAGRFADSFDAGRPAVGPGPGRFADGFDAGRSAADLPSVGLEKAQEFIRMSGFCAKLTAAGTALIFLGVVTFLLLSALVSEGSALPFIVNEDVRDSLGLAPLLISVVAAVAVFIFSESRMEGFRFIKNGQFRLSPSAFPVLERQMLDYKPRYTLSVVIGTGLCILSPLFLFLGPLFLPLPLNDDYLLSLSLMLVCIGAAVSVFIIFGAAMEAHKQLLKADVYSDRARDKNKLPGIVASILFPLAACIFLFWGFVFGRWGVSWIVFPVAGILYGIFCAVYNAVKE